MKRALILHGTSGSPEGNWFPWLKAELEKRNYEVWVPELPGNDRPNRQVYNDFLFNSGWDFAGNLIIGHSSGAVSVLNLLSDQRFPKVHAAVMVSAWHDSEKATLRDGGLSPEIFKELFPKHGFDPQTIQEKADNTLFVHSDNDPYCPLDQARWLAEQFSTELVVIHNGDHLGSKYKELPELLEILESRKFV